MILYITAISEVMDGINYRLKVGEKDIRFYVEHVPLGYDNVVEKLGFVRDDDTFYRSFPGHYEGISSIFTTFRQSFPQIVLQQADEIPVSWRGGLLQLCQLLEEVDLHWWLLGSAALAVRGIDITPRDADLITTKRGAAVLGEVLADHLVEPVFKTDWIGRYFGRSFPDFRIEWVGDVINKDSWVINNYGKGVEKQLETVVWEGYPIKVPPVELLLEQSRDRGLHGRVVKINKYLKS